ncbi:MAG: polysaccharide biosynthesis protein [Lentimicrobiaceae bacterium]|nr:polysaccharide biosynthesis protein [Lentimicrobiaceae bacterium]
MRKFLFDKLLSNRTMPNGIIWLLDVLIVSFATFLAVLFRMNFRASIKFYSDELIVIFGVILAVRGLSYLIFRPHTRLLRYTSTRDMLQFFWVNLFGSLLFASINGIYFSLNRKFVVPFSIILLEFIFSTFFAIFYRLFIRSIYSEHTVTANRIHNVLIFGAGFSGVSTKRSISRESNGKYKVVGFIDEDPQKIGKRIDGLTIYGNEDIQRVVQEKHVNFVIIAINNISNEKRNQITDTCLQYNVKTLLVPPMERWINGELSFKQIKKIQIEELLERDPIRMNDSKIQKDLFDKVILITGAAGSIGSEIVRQLLKYDYKQMILVDNSESPTYYLELELSEQKSDAKRYDSYLADICDEALMEELFRKYKPDIVYHAAAYKHVPLMEKNPMQAVKINVKGTKILADLSIKYQASKFIMVSTDKAVNPTNVMGASKRIAEIYVQSLGKQHPQCKFITTRFGNVLGSNGSIIPLFKQQIDKGGPITITHPEVTRYFMTIPEACDLVLHAGTMGNGGEIYIFDMGESVKILDLAKKMISLSGLVLGKDIQIVFTKLRPGEKLYEELLATKENTIETKNKKIKIAKVREYDFSEIESQIEELINLIHCNNNMNLVRQMKNIVPEFKSQNSVYKTLDED